MDPLDAELLVLGNLTRDQLDRFGEVRAIAEQWREVCTTHPEIRVIANASDPHVVWAAEPSNPIWVALGAPWRSDAATCPRCAALLDWSDDRFDCPSCGFAQPETPHRLDGDALVLDGERIPMHLRIPGTWNRMNAALALAAAVLHFEVPIGRAVAGLATVEVVSGRFSTRRLPDGRDARVLLAKNPAGWTEVLRWLQGTDTGASCSRSTRTSPTGATRPGSGTSPTSCCAACRSPPAASVRSMSRCGSTTAASSASWNPTRSSRRRGCPGTTVDIIASYTQFTQLTKRSW